MFQIKNWSRILVTYSLEGSRWALKVPRLSYAASVLQTPQDYPLSILGTGNTKNVKTACGQNAVLLSTEVDVT
jgi:hypothetical protein